METHCEVTKLIRISCSMKKVRYPKIEKLLKSMFTPCSLIIGNDYLTNNELWLWKMPNIFTDAKQPDYTLLQLGVQKQLIQWALIKASFWKRAVRSQFAKARNCWKETEMGLKLLPLGTHISCLLNTYPGQHLSKYFLFQF